MDFSALKELVQIISRNRVKHIAVLGNPGQEGKRTDKLYDILSKGKVESDLEAARALLGPKATKNHTYNRIRQRLTKQLVNSVFFMDFDKPQYIDRVKAYHNCYRDLIAANLLFVNRADKSACAILVEVMEISNKYEYVELKAQAASLLSLIYSRNNFSRQEYKYYFYIYKKSAYENRWIQKARIFYEDLAQSQVVFSSKPHKLYRKGKKYFDKLLRHESRIEWAEFQIYLYLIACAIYATIGNHRVCHKFANKLHTIIHDNPNVNRGIIVLIISYLLASSVQLQINSHELVSKLYIECQKNALKNWGSFHVATVYYLIFLLHQKSYDVVQIYLNAFSGIPDDIANNPLYAEHITLLAGYLFLLSAFGKIPREPLEEIFGPFRIGKFLNSFTLFPREKHARNIPIILLPLLFALAEGKTKYKGPSPEALHKYRQRRLETEQNRRSAIFVRLLLAQVDKLDNPDDTRSAERRIETELAALRALPMKDVPQPHMVEIIPYEHLWDMLTEAEAGRSAQPT